MKANRASWIVTAVALTGCAGGQSPLNPGGDQASHLAGLFNLMLVVCGIMYLLVLGFLGWAIWRARHRLEPALHGHERGLSLSLSAWAAIIVVGLTVLAGASFLTDRSLALASAQNSLTVRVTGHQWWWRIAYQKPDGQWVETANELHLPAGRTARIELGSADVIHSFWAPTIAGKTDVIPGKANVQFVTPRRVGWVRGQCTEFCGLQHAHMALDVKVDSPADFDRWLAHQADPAPAPSDPVLQRGQQVLTGGACAACHVVRGTTAAGRPGPDLTHIGSRRSIAAGLMPFSRGGLQGWIAQPAALKPGTMMPAVSLAPADADAVSRYLEWLK